MCEDKVKDGQNTLWIPKIDPQQVTSVKKSPLSVFLSDLIDLRNFFFLIKMVKITSLWN